jgi:site-specific DNA recombinase
LIEKRVSQVSEGRPNVALSAAAVYARTSSPNQRFNYSIDEQVNECWQYCEEREWFVKYVFVDEAQRGRTIERPKFQLMLERAEAREFQVIVFWKLDRFCRSLKDLVNLEKNFGQWGVKLCSVTEFLDTSSAVGRFNYRNLASVAELESEIIGERSRLGLYGLAREHKWPNSFPPLGYVRNEKGQLIISPPQARLVRRVFQLYLDTRSLSQVAFRLNQEKIPTKKGQWNARAIRDILTNQLYIGNYQVAGVSDEVPDLRLVRDVVFSETGRIMTRYKDTDSAKRSPMTLNRKAARIETIHNRFMEFLETHQEPHSPASVS